MGGKVRSIPRWGRRVNGKECGFSDKSFKVIWGNKNLMLVSGSLGLEILCAILSFVQTDMSRVWSLLILAELFFLPSPLHLLPFFLFFLFYLLKLWYKYCFMEFPAFNFEWHNLLHKLPILCSAVFWCSPKLIKFKGLKHQFPTTENTIPFGKRKTCLCPDEGRPKETRGERSLKRKDIQFLLSFNTDKRLIL